MLGRNLLKILLLIASWTINLSLIKKGAKMLLFLLKNNQIQVIDPILGVDSWIATKELEWELELQFTQNFWAELEWELNFLGKNSDSTPIHHQFAYLKKKCM